MLKYPTVNTFTFTSYNTS